MRTVREILLNVKKRGDAALKEYAWKFDRVSIRKLKADKKKIQNSEKNLDAKLKKAIKIAYENIYRFHKAQEQPELKIETMPGVICRRKSVAIENIGFYIPGGSAPLFSTILMLTIPAKIAGCRNITLCTPPSPEGIHPAILYTAKLCGINNIFQVGGAQAIAAMAYGTKSIPKADKIFGPGNQYVTTAKMLVSTEGIAIDMPAGPSEVCAVADRSCNPSFVAADLLSQAEHGPDSQVLLIGDHYETLLQCTEQVQKLMMSLPRKKIAEQALKNSRAILVRNMKEAIDIANEYAPEHLILACKNAGRMAHKIINAGSVFIGHYSPESIGDYASGTNHTLPTSGYARAYGGVSLDSFVKKITFQEISRKGLQNIGPYVEVMAKAEKLDAHALAINIRYEL